MPVRHKGGKIGFMLSKLRKAITEALKSVGVESADISTEHPAELKNGDYSTGVALQYTKQAGMPPRSLAEKLVALMGTIKGVAKIEIAGPGFINFYLTPSEIAVSLKSACTEEHWGSNRNEKGKKIMVEYTDPNPFKEFHIGHLMSNTIGESISRLLQFSGATVKRANYQGDVGPHVAKAIWGIRKLGLDASSAVTLGKAYAAGAKAYEEDAAAKKEMDDINAKVYDHSDAEIDSLYTAGREASLEHFETIYAMLGTKFDYYFFESETTPIGIELVRSHPEVFEESDGAIVYKGEQDGLHTRVFLTSHGLPTYEAKDLGLIKLKAGTWPADISITVTANEQAEYFKVMKAAAMRFMPELAQKVLHITHGMMRFASGKMSSRTGNVVTGESLLAELIEAAKERAEDSRADDLEKLANQVAVAAIKYQVLRQASHKDIVFDKERALSIEGDSGPYLQYAHARARGIVRKAEEQGVFALIDENAKPSELARVLHRFPEAVEYAARELEPHLLTNYILDVASRFNSWYAEEQILDGTPAAAHKVAIAEAVGRTLKNGLWVLGMPAPEKM
jgi:arginyl-tRNA synthetase